MPIEIKELHIKATVNGKKQAEPDGSPIGGSGMSEMEKKLLINQCVEKVLEVLKEKAER